MWRVRVWWQLVPSSCALSPMRAVSAARENTRFSGEVNLGDARTHKRGFTNTHTHIHTHTHKPHTHTRTSTIVLHRCIQSPVSLHHPLPLLQQHLQGGAWCLGRSARPLTAQAPQQQTDAPLQQHVPRPLQPDRPQPH